MRSGTSFTFAFLTLTGCYVDGPDEQLSTSTQDARVRGAIFTTLADGTSVNHNIYSAKEDVYLDGGPSGGSPSSAASLAAGDYYFQVTDPSGQTLLSQDNISCRRIEISSDGVIATAYSGANGCQHAIGVDQDYASLGALTVQLMPYADTPNPGGVYKVWVTPVGAYQGGGYSPGQFHGFIPSFSKTDTFKVRVTIVAPPDDPPPPPDDEPPPPHVCVCGDGQVDGTEECDDGNNVDGDGCSATCQLEVPPAPCCGDGHLDSSEQCDDGNVTSGDGCSATCELEYGSPDFDHTCDVCIERVQTRPEDVFVY